MGCGLASTDEHLAALELAAASAKAVLR
jgi:hypothetical protein